MVDRYEKSVRDRVAADSAWAPVTRVAQAIESSSGYTSITISDLQANGGGQVANPASLTTQVDVSFDPPKSPATLTSSQKLRFRMRASDGVTAGAPVAASLRENGSLVANLLNTNLATAAGQEFEVTFDPGDLADPTGADLVLRLSGVGLEEFPPYSSCPVADRAEWAIEYDDKVENAGPSGWEIDVNEWSR